MDKETLIHKVKELLDNASEFLADDEFESLIKQITVVLLDAMSDTIKRSITYGHKL